MSQFDSRPPKDNKPPRNGGGNDPNSNWRGILLVVIGISLIVGYFAIRNTPYTTGASAAKNGEFLTFLKNDEINPEKGVDLSYEDGSPYGMFTLTAWLKPGTKDNSSQQDQQIHTTVFTTSADDELHKALEKKGITPSYSKLNTTWSNLAISFLPIAAFLLILYFLFRQQIRMAGKGAMSFGKSKARMLSRDKNKITFKDVAGVDEAKDEVQELVEFLKDPKRFQKLGGRIPKGVLMVGPPGTGKTLLARAIAGEADVPFFSISGSDFVEMFVGVGASRVRDMFEQGKKSAPCIIFIDEIDAVGRHRGHGLGGGHDEREQTLNALLVEMDGFDTQEGVIIIAATNRADVLDPALLRPGRFDRQVVVNLPDVKGREEILRVHARKVKLADGVDLGVIARGTPGFSGAELANLINEAALLAARKGLKGIMNAELEEARDKVRWGRERRSMAMSEKEKASTAWHEAGHAIVNVLLEHTDPLHKVSIIPRGRALGVTMFLPEGDQHSMQRKEAIDLLAVTAGGRIAEEIYTADLSSGAAMDIKQMTRLARVMICEWGMSEILGMVEYGGHEDQVFLGRDINRSRDYSEATAQEIDREVRKLVDEAYARATGIITQNRDKVEAIAKALLEYETLDAVQTREIIEHGHMLNPPPPPSAPPPVEPPPLPTRDISPEYPGGLTQAPA